jgi:chemotaxis response regulator CheB
MAERPKQQGQRARKKLPGPAANPLAPPAAAAKEGPLEPSSSSAAFPIVGIGASAGGLKALTQLLQELPVSTDLAFVLVQHLHPTHKSMLPELLSRVTRIPVQ